MCEWFRQNRQYLSYIIRHKYFVFKAGLEVRKVKNYSKVSLWRLIKHDWSKFLPSEWKPYRMYFYGKHRDSLEKWHRRGDFDKAWLKHQHRNDHHWQHWFLRNDNGSNIALMMPDEAMYEMIADWMGSGRAITGRWEALSWFKENYDSINLHPVTKARVYFTLSVLHKKGMA